MNDLVERFEHRTALAVADAVFELLDRVDHTIDASREIAVDVREAARRFGEIVDPGATLDAGNPAVLVTENSLRVFAVVDLGDATAVARDRGRHQISAVVYAAPWIVAVPFG